MEQATERTPCYNGFMSGFFQRFLLPALFLSASVYALRLATMQGSFLLYFLAAVLLGMAIASYLRTWKRPPGR